MTGQEFTAWRKRLGLTQEQAATQLDVSRRAVIDWERGTTPIRRQTEIAVWTLEHRRDLEHELAPLCAGDIHVSAKRMVGGHVEDRDTTQDMIDRLKTYLVEINQIVSDHATFWAERGL